MYWRELGSHPQLKETKVTILLTTPANPGDNDPGKSYPRAKVVRATIDLVRETADIVVVYGDVDGDDWVVGTSPNGVEGMQRQHHRIEIADLGTLLDTVENKCELFLISKGYISGTQE